LNPNDKVTPAGPDDAVIVSGGEPQVVSVKTEPVPEKTVDQKRQEAWETLVAQVIRRSKGLKAEEAVVLPKGETGHYIKYAYDNQGRFSMGKGHGRRKVRTTSLKAEMGRIYSQFANQLLTAGLTAAFKRSKAEAEQASTPENKVEPKPITADKMKEIQTWAVTKAQKLTEEVMSAPAKAKAKAARKRHRLARRINFGLVPGNCQRAAHSAG